ncbi:11634_t:CDS:2 [Acaulospora morrowiae]|uniref:11634_t:CDS:1 n=1 Tax=Acaulospora morrowiae TaxID=94023 RepID=A0A9N9ETD5_9GLOM|nr:11634_t:CDS:2 [Acaulospora morrowiae]
MIRERSGKVFFQYSARDPYEPRPGGSSITAPQSTITFFWQLFMTTFSNAVLLAVIKWIVLTANRVNLMAIVKVIWYATKEVASRITMTLEFPAAEMSGL